MTTSSLLITLTCATASAADSSQVKYLAHANQSLSAFATGIANAKKSVDIATYIFEPCHSSVQVLMDELKERAKAGVKVRVILDAFEQSKEQKANLQRDFAAAGIELRIYAISATDIDTRMHNKFTIIDNQVYIAGGRNISDSYFGLASDLNYVDRDVMVQGRSVQDATNSFNEIWNSSKVESVETSDAAAFTAWSQFCAKDPTPFAQQIRSYLDANAKRLLQSATTRTCPVVEFSDDHSDYADAQYGPGWGSGKGADSFLTRSRLSRKISTRAVLDFINGTEKNLMVENWSYMPIFDVEAAFTSLRDRNIPLIGIANQDMEPDGPSFFWQAEDYSGAVISERDSVGSESMQLISSLGALGDKFDLTPAGAVNYIHAKVLTRDGQDALVSSFNIDSRSANINLEVAVVIKKCPDFVADVTEAHAQVIEQLEADHANPQLPPAEEPSFFAKIFSVLGVTEF